jgi:hypothetical protein
VDAWLAKPNGRPVDDRDHIAIKSRPIRVLSPSQIRNNADSDR